MPEKIDSCVESCLADPDFKPRDPDQSKEDACWALCTWLDQQGALESELPITDLSQWDSGLWHEAVIMMVDRAIAEWDAEEVVERSVTSLQGFGLASPDASWSFSAADGSAILDRGGWSLYKRVHFYWDPSADSDHPSTPEVKGAYKLPYAKISGGSVKIFRRALLAVQGILLGARGGVGIPAADKKSIARQVIKGLRKFDTEPTPRLRDLARTGKEPDLMLFSLEKYVQFYVERGVVIDAEDLRGWPMFGEELEEDLDKQGWPYCVCPECGYTEDKVAGVACRTKKCPDCGVALMGSQVSGKVSTGDSDEVAEEACVPYTFRVVLPVTCAEERVVRVGTQEEERTEYWLHIEASGPEQDSSGDWMSEACLERFVTYAEKGIDGQPLPYLDGHYQDLLAAMLGKIHNPRLTDEKHFAIDVRLDVGNPQALRLFYDVKAGKRHGASIAGLVHEFSIRKYEDEDGEELVGRVFEDIELIEVSRTTWPSWRGSFTEMVMRHMEPADSCAVTELVARKSMIADAMPVLGRVPEAHGWDRSFGVSDAPWDLVGDLTHRHQYAVVRRHPDGAFSPSQSGFPHHLPTGEVSRSGLDQAIKDLVASLETGDKKFLTAEVEVAAEHLARHAVEDLGEPVPDGLSGLVSLSDLVEVEKMTTVDVEKTDSAELEVLSQESVQTDEPAEVVVEAQEQAVEPVVENPEILVPEAAVEELDEEPDEDETEPEPEPEPQLELQESTEQASSELEQRLATDMASRKMSALVFSMQELLAESLWKNGIPAEERVELGGQVLDQFVEMAKELLPVLANAAPEENLLNAFIERIELVQGGLTRQRADRFKSRIAGLVEDALRLSSVLDNLDLLAEPEPNVEIAVTELRHEVDEDLNEIRGRLSDAVDKTVKSEREKLAEILERLSRTADAPQQSRLAQQPASVAPDSQTAQDAEWGRVKALWQQSLT